jgi:hypothetical protein
LGQFLWGEFDDITIKDAIALRVLVQANERERGRHGPMKANGNGDRQQVRLKQAVS